jgi:MoxR-like ATPase
LVFITSNDERRLPPAFLRRCVCHHIDMTDDLLRTAVQSHRQRYPQLDDGFLDTAIRCFLQIRQRTKEKPPATGELLAWLQVLSIATGCRPEVLDADLRQLPFLSTLIKHPEDLLELQRMS